MRVSAPLKVRVTSGVRVRHASSARRSKGDERGRYERCALGARLIFTVLHRGGGGGQAT